MAVIVVALIGVVVGLFIAPKFRAAGSRSQADAGLPPVSHQVPGNNYQICNEKSKYLKAHGPTTH